MATLVLSTVGATLGASAGATAFWATTGAVIGQAVGAAVGSSIDNALFNNDRKIDVGRVDSYRVQGSDEGAPILRSFGRTRVAGQIIWRDHFVEETSTTRHRVKLGPSTTTTEYSYTVNVAIALGEGVIHRLGRIWADGEEIDPAHLNLTLYAGHPDQTPDPLIAAHMGLENTPAFRGTAYVVIEALNVTEYGNRIPQLNFEIFRKAAGQDQEDGAPYWVTGVSMIPGSGEFVYGTTPVQYDLELGKSRSANQIAGSGGTDFERSLDQLSSDFPNVKTVALVVSWFGTDLRAGMCQLEPRVEYRAALTEGADWQVAGKSRKNVSEVSRRDGKPAYGGTPSDHSVIEAIKLLKKRGYHVVLYPFIQMDIQKNQNLPQPGFPNELQPDYPWRGRITANADKTAQARSEIEGFLGRTRGDDFHIKEGLPVAPAGDTGFRNFILHYAHLAAASGGVDGFLIGSELRGLTRVRDENDVFPFVAGLRSLAQETRALLPEAELSYAADWSEYFGYHPSDSSGDVFYNLDPLWADNAIDYVGIDAYFPLTDFRSRSDQENARQGRTDADFMETQFEAGEGFEWYYANPEDRDAQNRTPIRDGAYQKPWVYRYKDIRNWWARHHFERRGGQETHQTLWAPESKPIRFTELGCPAITFGSNQPNVFFDPKSDEGKIPYFSDGQRDDNIQENYLIAFYRYWSDPENNPLSKVDDRPMIDIARSCAWTWDARPYPYFPAREDVWSDGKQHGTGHWLTGRYEGQPLRAILAEFCELAGVKKYDVSRVQGRVTGYLRQDVDPVRGDIESLAKLYDLTIHQRGDTLVFEQHKTDVGSIKEAELIAQDENASVITQTLHPETESISSVTFRFWESEDSYDARRVQSLSPDGVSRGGDLQIQIPIVEDPFLMQAHSIALLSEMRGQTSAVSFALPPSYQFLNPGDQFRIEDQSYEVEEIAYEGVLRISAKKNLFEKNLIAPQKTPPRAPKPIEPAARPMVRVMNLPKVSETASPFAPYIAATAKPWPDAGLAVFSAHETGAFELDQIIARPALLGRSITPLLAAHPSRWDNGDAVLVDFSDIDFATLSEASLLGGGNAFAIGSALNDSWEIFQAQRVDVLSETRVALSRRLRGQFGTDTAMPEVWPTGSDVVFLDQRLVQPDISEGSWDIPHHYRIGPAHLPKDAPDYRLIVSNEHGAGLRPYAPVHIKWSYISGDQIRFTWIPRLTQIQDNWRGDPQPMSSRFMFQITNHRGQRIEAEVDAPEITFAQARVHAHADGHPLEIGVAAYAELYGFGQEQKRIMDVILSQS